MTNTTKQNSFVLDTEDPNKHHALVIGATGGIGNMLTEQLAKRSDVIIHSLSRSNDEFDITNEDTIIAAAREYARKDIKFSLLIVATGILETASQDCAIKAGPEKAFLDLETQNAVQAFSVNALGPALVFKHFKSLLNKNERCLFTALSARVGSIGDNGLGGWMSYRASKAALNQFIRCGALELKRSHKKSIVIALHPGTIETTLTRQYARGRYTASPEDAATQILATLDNLSSEDSGKFFAYDGSTIPW